MNAKVIRGTIKELQSSSNEEERITGNALAHYADKASDEELKLVLEKAIKDLSTVLSGMRKALCRKSN
jgi:hypothetical protein